MIRGWFARKSLTRTPDSGASIMFGLQVGQSLLGTYRFLPYAKEGYQENGTVFSCIKQIVMASQAVKLKLIRTNPNDNSDTEMPATHPAAMLFNKPNQFMTYSQFLETTLSYLYIGGAVYIRKISATGGKPKELMPIRPDWITPTLGTTQEIVEYKFNNGAQSKTFSPEEIVSILFFNPVNMLSGMSPILPSATSIDMANEGKKWNLALTKNSGRAPGVLKTKSQLTKDQRVGFLNAIHTFNPAILEAWTTGTCMAGTIVRSMYWRVLTPASRR